MAYINLLPWREVARQEEKQKFLVIVGAIVTVCAVIMLGINQFYVIKADGQQKRNSFLSQEISVLKQQIAEIEKLKKMKQDLQKRINLIEQLQASRNLGTLIMDEVAQVVPAGVYLTTLEKKGVGISIVGKSESNNRLANMMREVEESELLAEAVISEIVTGKQKLRLLSDFKMSMKIKGYDAVQGGEK